MIQFSIIGEPTGKGRPKFSRMGGYVKTYTPRDTANYEQWVKLAYIEKYGNRKSFEGKAALSVKIDAYFSIPKSTSKKKSAMMMAGYIRPTKKPDYDNIAKIVTDALNGLVYDDDAQIVSADIEKHYVRAADEPARVEVRIQTIE